MRNNLYKYYKVIQQNYGNGWEDVSDYETNSTGTPLEYYEITTVEGKRPRKISLVRLDLREYNLTGYPTRVIRRKVKNIN